MKPTSSKASNVSIKVFSFLFSLGHLIQTITRPYRSNERETENRENTRTIIKATQVNLIWKTNSTPHHAKIPEPWADFHQNWHSWYG